MFPDQLKKILKLIKKTGDKVIIYNDNDPDNSYALMSLGQYENLVFEDLEEKTSDESLKSTVNNMVDLTPEDLTDRINCDISSWKNQENSPYLNEESKPRNPWAIPAKIKNGAQKIE